MNQKKLDRVIIFVGTFARIIARLPYPFKNKLRVRCLNQAI